MRKTTKQHIATLAIASLVVRVMLAAVFAPMFPSSGSALSSQITAADGTVLTTVICASHGTMTIPVTDIGIDTSGEPTTQGDGQSSIDPYFCPFCQSLAAGVLPSITTASIWAPLPQTITHARPFAPVLPAQRAHRIAQPRAPPSLPTSRV